MGALSPGGQLGSLWSSPLVRLVRGWGWRRLRVQVHMQGAHATGRWDAECYRAAPGTESAEDEHSAKPDIIAPLLGS